MDESWREAFAAHARTREFWAKVKEARGIIKEHFWRHPKAYAAFSGGKDSTVMTHLVLASRPRTMVLHWDYGRAYIPDAVHDEILAIARAVGADLRIETSPEYERLGRQAVGILGKHLVGWLLPRLHREGYTGSFVGLRAAESGKRRRRISAGKSLSPIEEAWPLRSWSWMDVWAYLVRHELPFLSAYQAAAPVVGYDQVRFCTFFDPEFARMADATDGVLHWRYRHL